MSRYNGAGPPRSMARLLADPPPPTPTLLEPALVVEGGITVLAAPTKVGKTNFWLHAAWALTEGKSLFGRFDVARPTSVLMLQLELSEPTMHRRLSTLAGELEWSEQGQKRFEVWCGRALLLDRRGGPEKVIEIIRSLETTPDVVILDSYNAVVAGDPDRSSEARRALHALRTVQEATGVTWCVTSEIRKAPAGMRLKSSIDDLKGSNEIAYDADAVVLLRPGESDRRRLRISFAAMRHATSDPPDNLVLVRRGLTFDLTEGPGDELTGAIEKVLREHLKAGGNTSWRACMEAVRAADVSARDTLIGTVRKRLLESSAAQQTLEEV